MWIGTMGSECEDKHNEVELNENMVEKVNTRQMQLYFLNPLAFNDNRMIY